jgi:hypothetical protein
LERVWEILLEFQMVCEMELLKADVLGLELDIQSVLVLGQELEHVLVMVLDIR